MKVKVLSVVSLFVVIVSTMWFFTTIEGYSQDPPVVVKTVPAADDMNVDPSLDRIEVTFSRNMMTKDMWSWVMESKNSFPKITGDVKYLDDKRTCVAPVKLEPGKQYVIWFNSKKFDSFRSTDNVPAVPYRLMFKTRQ